MKQFIASLLLLVALFTMIPGTVFATSTEERAGIQNEWMETEGVAHPVGSYVCNKRLQQYPATMEVWVYLPKDIYDQEAGTVIGNYSHKNKDCFTFSIGASGVPHLILHTKRADQDLPFFAAAIPADTWAHVAIVYEEDTKQLLCYLNGELKGDYKKIDLPAGVLNDALCIAGDRATMNKNGFHGILGDVTLYADARTQQEIAEDMTAPALQDSDLLLHYAITGNACDIPDASGNGYDMRYDQTWLTQEEMDQLLAEDSKEYTYSFAFLPDIQYTTEYNADKLHKPFDYVLENQKAKNIRYFITLGDLTNSNTQEEWDIFSQQIKRLDGVLPYSLIQGNHDMLESNAQPLFDQYFSNESGAYYQYTAANGGFFDEKSVRNTYHLFTAGDVDYLLLNLDFGATDDVLAWADTVLSQYPERFVIVSTHSYLITDGKLLTGDDIYTPTNYLPFLNNGDDIWDKLLRKHANVRMVVCGHYSQDGLVHSTATGDNGNTVHQLLMDVQSSDKLLKSLGVVSLMEFTQDGRYARVQFYSTTQEKYFKESTTWVELDFGEMPTADTDSDSPDSYLLPIILICAGVLIAASLIVVIIVIKKKKA